jgi:predicted dehydrogenase
LQKLRIGVVGAGRMGRIRSLSAKAHPRCELVEVVDAIAEHARMLAAETGCQAGTDWQELIERGDVDAIVVATPHKYLAPITTAALNAGKSVFCEKPGARNATEAGIVLKTASGNRSSGESEPGAPSTPRNHSRLVVGFTLRHYPAVARARELVDAGVIGVPMYVRGRYGHGGRPDYDLEWRGDPELAGGGELLDQGVHLIDLSRWFLGEFGQVFGSVNTYFWNSRQNSSNTSLEDNAFLSLRTEAGRMAWLHASWTQWKNLFSFEIYGEDGSLQINGLSGHYGIQRLQIARRRPEGGAPEVQETDFPAVERQNAQDSVWTAEWAAFISSVLDNNDAGNGKLAAPSASGVDAWETLKIVEAAYEASRTGTVVALRRMEDEVCNAISSEK